VYGFNELNEFTFKFNVRKLTKSLNRYESICLSLLRAKLKQVTEDRKEKVRESAEPMYRLDKSRLVSEANVGIHEAN
jgi:hypothetical protein